MTAPTPAEVRRAMAGDEVARTDLCLAFLPRIHGLARRVTGRADLAEEAAQEAILRILRGLPGLRDPERIEAWVLTIAGNTARKLLARQGRERPLVEEPLVGTVSPVEAEGRRQLAVDHAVASLAPVERELFILHTVEGVRLRELATEHETNENAMKARVHRIRTKVRSRALAHLLAGETP